MSTVTGILNKCVALLLLPLALFAGSSFAMELMSCRAQGVVRSSCCCPPPAVRVPVDEHPQLEQGCCERFTLTVASEAPGPQGPPVLAPLAPPLASELPFVTFASVEVPHHQAPRAERVPDATGPPLRVLYCSYLT